MRMPAGVLWGTSMKHFVSVLKHSVPFLVLLAGGAQAQRVPDYSVYGAATTRNSTGLSNPYTMLRLPAAQAVATEALAGRLSAERLAALLRGSEVQIQHLLDASVLAPTGDGNYRLAMTVLTVADRELLDRVADPLGRSLAAAFLAERAAFDRILARYDMPGVDPALVRMALIGCAILDWDGLRLTAAENYRALPVPRPNGDRFQMVLRERAPHLSGYSIYVGSHNAPAAGDTVWMTTFGDAHRGGRRVGFPDLTWIVEGSDLEAQAPAPIAAELARSLGARMEEAQDIAAPIMMALRNGAADAAALARAAGRSAEQVQPILDLLVAIQYVESRDGTYRALIPVFTLERDGEMIRGYRALGRQVMNRWLRANYARAQQDLSGLAALRAGVPFRTMFTELWHPIFGWTNYHLVRQGYLYDPYGPTARYISFAPFVWDAQLRLESFS